MPAATAPTANGSAAGRRAARCTRGWRLGAAGAVLAGAALLASFTPLTGTAPCFAHGDEPAHSAELDAMIVRAAKRHGVPERLLRRIVMRESKYNPHARNHRYWGLMQISYPTARSMGFRGSPEELLNPLTNLTYAVPYLANAFIAAGKSEEAAVRLYASGYYDTARRRGLLGLLRTAESTPVVNAPEPALAQAAPQPEGGSLLASLFGASEPSPAAQPQLVAAVQPPDAPAPAPDRTADQPPRAAGALPEGRATRGGATLALDGSGRARPPARWLRDGGLTVLGRGEQGDRALAATRVAAGDAASAGRSGKTAVYASLDVPGARPAAAQAYAASASDETAAPQAAISQVLAAPAQAETKQPDGKQAEGKPAAAGNDKGDGDGGETHRRKHRHHARHRAVHERNREAAAETAAPDGRP